MALLIVLLTLFALGGMAAVFAYSMKVETRLAMNTSNAGELEWLGRSGVEYAKWILMQQDRVMSERGFHALNQFWRVGLGPLNRPTIRSKASPLSTYPWALDRFPFRSATPSAS